ncbi:MAG: SpoIIE family protein phosphatase [Immundisolibacteraceae bacterium]|nr:SpoIIE family protein phosphatase [Immundisolibacteraceae bacterium]
MAKILVVDDLPSNRLLLQRLCEKFGHETIAAEDGALAVAAATGQSPDLILLDISMPNMDGYEAAGLIKAEANSRPDDAYLPIIFVTAQTSDSSLSQAIQAGGDDFIAQPVRAEVLESKISAHLRIRELNQQLVENNRELSLYNRRLRQEADLIGHFFDKALQRSYQDPQRFHYHTSPASAFNGDIMLMSQGPVGQIYVLVGDFTGHGLQAAMGTMPVQQAFFDLCEQGVVLPELVRQINGYLYQSLPDSMFFAANALLFDQSFSKVEMWMGGMPPGYLVSDQGEELMSFASMHMPLGIQPEVEFRSATLNYDLPVDSRLYLYSDGAIERKDARGNIVGEEGLRELMQTIPAEGRFKKMVTTLVSNDEGQDQLDDISLIEVRCGKL